jgi:hypothetical protein
METLQSRIQKLETVPRFPNGIIPPEIHRRDRRRALALLAVFALLWAFGSAVKGPSKSSSPIWDPGRQAWTAPYTEAEKDEAMEILSNLPAWMEKADAKKRGY